MRPPGTFSVASACRLPRLVRVVTHQPSSGGASRKLRSSKPRVALVAHNIHEEGGMERACAELIRNGSKEVDFCIISSELAPELRHFVQRWIRVDVPARPFPLKFAAFWLRAGKAVHSVDADLVHTVGAIIPNRVDLASVHFCHTAFVFKNHRLASPGTPLLRRLNTAISRTLAMLAERWCYQPSRLRAFGAVSKGVADEVALHFPNVPRTVTPNGADLSRFHPDPHARAELRNAQSAGATTTIALFVGGDWDRKGLKLAIASVAMARSTGFDIELWVVGQGDQARFSKFSVEHGVGSHVRFHGFRRNPEHFYQAADLVVLPSSYETFSLVCFEAAASGLPLVIPPISGATEIVGKDEGGILTERSVPSIAAAFARLAADRELRTELGNEARRRARLFTWERSTASVTALYDLLLAST
jgi:UDP-glucose:(heptosyl)LPS alpha-1,3-glucosyltransferase